jgi:manganese/zinc/iron transport system permease protein
VAGIEVPRQLFTIGPVLLLNLVFIAILWKELKISSFDPGLANTQGISATWMHYGLMAVVAMTTVASFEAVGSILVVAMLIVPAATAHLLTDRLVRMLQVACAIAVLSAVLGFVVGAVWDVQPAGAMAVVAGLCYALAVFCSPRYGVISKLVNNFHTSLRVVREDIIAMLYRVEEVGGEKRLPRGAAAKAMGSGLLARLGIRTLLRDGEIEVTDSGLNLTDSGRNNASRLVRSHRLWESFLVHHLGLPPDRVHQPAERVEHFIGNRMREALKQQLDDTARDPHGREIPDE